jgi:hypothetical protein
MQNKILINIIILLFLIIFIIYPKKEKKQIPDKNWVEIINENNKKINKIQADLHIKKSFFHAKGYACYEKKDKFKLFLPNILEIGSNSNLIWFWSENLNPRYLYFCDTNNLKNSRLKKIFYPENVRQMLFVDEIEFENAIMLEDKIILEKRNQDIKKVITIKNSTISECCFYENDILILQIKIKEHQKIEGFIVPKNIEINWVLEKINLFIELEKVKINNIDYYDWEIPNYKHKIDISNY